MIVYALPCPYSAKYPRNPLQALSNHEGRTQSGLPDLRKSLQRVHKRRKHYVTYPFSWEIGDRATERGCGREADATGRGGGADGTDASAGDWVCRQTWRQTQSPAGAVVKTDPPPLNVGGGTPPYPLGVAVCPLTFVPFRAEGVGTSGSACAHQGA